MYSSKLLLGGKLLLDTFSVVSSRVSNGTGQCNFLGQRDRSSFIVPGQRDNGTSQKSCQGTGRAGTAKIRDGTGRDSQNPGQDTGQNGTDVLKQENDVLKQKMMF